MPLTVFDVLVDIFIHIFYTFYLKLYYIFATFREPISGTGRASFRFPWPSTINAQHIQMMPGLCSPLVPGAHPPRAKMFLLSIRSRHNPSISIFPFITASALPRALPSRAPKRMVNPLTVSIFVSRSRRYLWSAQGPVFLNKTACEEGRPVYPQGFFADTLSM